MFTLASSWLQGEVHGRPAMGITSREFCGVMRRVSAAATIGAHELHPRLSCESCEKRLLYSFDHHKVHENARKLAKIAGIKPSQRVIAPPNSPDFQQPVEHAHGRFKQAFREAITKHPELRSRDVVEEFARELWFKVNTPKVVNKDVARLVPLYQFVRDVSMGGYATKELS